MIKMCLCEECKVFSGIVDDKSVLATEPIMFKYKCNVCGHTGYTDKIEEVDLEKIARVDS